MQSRILLVDDHEVMRKGLRALVNGTCEVCGEAADGEEAVDSVLRLKPDLVLMDVSMPGMNGIEATRKIRELSPATKVMIFTMHDSSQIRASALQAGAVDCVTKTATTEQIRKAISRALRPS